MFRKKTKDFVYIKDGTILRGNTAKDAKTEKDAADILKEVFDDPELKLKDVLKNVTGVKTEPQDDSENKNAKDTCNKPPDEDPSEKEKASTIISKLGRVYQTVSKADLLKVTALNKDIRAYEGGDVTEEKQQKTTDTKDQNPQKEALVEVDALNANVRGLHLDQQYSRKSTTKDKLPFKVTNVQVLNASVKGAHIRCQEPSEDKEHQRPSKDKEHQREKRESEEENQYVGCQAQALNADITGVSYERASDKPLPKALSRVAVGNVEAKGIRLGSASEQPSVEPTLASVQIGNVKATGVDLRKKQESSSVSVKASVDIGNVEITGIGKPQGGIDLQAEEGVSIGNVAIGVKRGSCISVNNKPSFFNVDLTVGKPSLNFNTAPSGFNIGLPFFGGGGSGSRGGGTGGGKDSGEGDTGNVGEGYKGDDEREGEGTAGEEGGSKGGIGTNGVKNDSGGDRWGKGRKERDDIERGVRDSTGRWKKNDREGGGSEGASKRKDDDNAHDYEKDAGQKYYNSEENDMGTERIAYGSPNIERRRFIGGYAKPTGNCATTRDINTSSARGIGLYGNTGSGRYTSIGLGRDIRLRRNAATGKCATPIGSAGTDSSTWRHTGIGDRTEIGRRIGSSGRAKTYGHPLTGKSYGPYDDATINEYNRLVVDSTQNEICEFKFGASTSTFGTNQKDENIGKQLNVNRVDNCKKRERGSQEGIKMGTDYSDLQETKPESWTTGVVRRSRGHGRSENKDKTSSREADKTTKETKLPALTGIDGERLVTNVEKTYSLEKVPRRPLEMAKKDDLTRLSLSQDKGTSSSKASSEDKLIGLVMQGFKNKNGDFEGESKIDSQKKDGGKKSESAAFDAEGLKKHLVDKLKPRVKSVTAEGGVNNENNQKSSSRDLKLPSQSSLEEKKEPVKPKKQGKPFGANKNIHGFHSLNKDESDKPVVQIGNGIFGFQD